MKNSFIVLAFVCLVVACTQSESIVPKQSKTGGTEQTQEQDLHDKELVTSSSDDIPEAKPVITTDSKIQIDWSFIDTKATQATLADYQYPIAIDSTAVKNYASTYGISPAKAQHSIVVSMAAPEALGKLLDQLEDTYISHELTDGANIKLIVHTKANVIADQREYVFADKFGEGLVLPIEIRPNK